MKLNTLTNYFLSIYKDKNLLHQNRAKALFYINILIIFVQPILAFILYNVQSKNNIIIPLAAVTLNLMLAFSGLFLIKRGSYQAGANIIIILSSIIFSAAFFFKLTNAPLEGYTTLIYFFYMQISLAALLCSGRIFLSVASYFIICDAVYVYLVISKQLLTPELTKVAIKAAAESGITMISMAIFLRVILYINKTAVSAAEIEAEKNQDQNRILNTILQKIHSVLKLLGGTSGMSTISLRI